METKKKNSSYQWRRYNTDKEFREYRKAKAKEYRLKHKEEILDRLHAYRKRKKFAATNAARTYYQKNHDEIREKQRLYYARKTGKAVKPKKPEVSFYIKRQIKAEESRQWRLNHPKNKQNEDNNNKPERLQLANELV